jgi:hypothetical protein
MYRVSFIGQLFPLFTQVEEISGKIIILEILCYISYNTVDHALDPLSIFNHFKPRELSDSSFLSSNLVI